MFSINASIHPLRLKSASSDYALLNVSIQNTSTSEALCSLRVSLPKELGFQRGCLSHSTESRIGILGPGADYSSKFQIWSSQNTPPAVYPIKITAVSHYRSYNYILNEVSKKIYLRVV